MECILVPIEGLKGNGPPGIDRCRLSFGAFSFDFVMDFCSIVRKSSTREMDFYLVYADEGRCRALVYLISPLRNGTLRRCLPRPLRQCALVDIPLFQTPSVTYDHDVNEKERVDFLRSMIRLVRRELRVAILLVCHDESSAGLDRFLADRYGIGKTVTHTSLNLGYASFEEYLRSLPGRRRKSVRRTREKFQTAGGRSTVFRSPAPEGLYPLYQALKKEKGAGGPIGVEGSFFSEMFKCGACGPGLLVLYEDSEPIAFSSFFAAGSTLYLKLGGLDYQRLHEMHSYYNLFYSAIDLAIEMGYTKLDCGLTTNRFKEYSLGCDTRISRYSVVTIPILGRLVSLFVRVATTTRSPSRRPSDEGCRTAS